MAANHTTVYKKNSDYDQEKISRAIENYKFAKEIGDMEFAKAQMDYVTRKLEKLIYRILWTKYPHLMRNKETQNEIMQDMWVCIISKLDQYDPEKASPTTFAALWIKHVVSKYSSLKFMHTTQHYAEKIRRIDNAVSYCLAHDIPATTENIAYVAQMSEKMVEKMQEYKESLPSVSYEALSEAGIEEKSMMPSPEKEAIRMDLSRKVNGFITENFNEYEVAVMRFLINPLDDRKDKASYKEIAERLNAENIFKPGRTTPNNIPSVKETIEHITMVFASDETIADYVPKMRKPRSSQSMVTGSKKEIEKMVDDFEEAVIHSAGEA